MEILIFKKKLRNPKNHLRAKTRAGLVPNESQPRHKRERSSSHAEGASRTGGALIMFSAMGFLQSYVRLDGSNNFLRSIRCVNFFVKECVVMATALVYNRKRKSS